MKGAAPTEMATHHQAAVLSPPADRNGKEIAKQIFLEIMSELDLRRTMRQKVKCEQQNLMVGSDVDALARPPLILAFGKAANSMAGVMAETLGGEIERGIIVSPVVPEHRLARFSYFAGGHPYPTAESLAGGEAAMDLVRGRSADDLVMFLVSGGGSSLMEKPLDNEVTLADLVDFNHLLVTCGLPIEQINVLRKHISAIKGGRLAAAAFPARQLTVLVSDVPHGRESMVASGPTMPDESTTGESYAIGSGANLAEKFPAPIRRRFRERTLPETPKPGDECFSNSRYFCLLSNRDAVQAAKSAVERAGLVCEIAGGDWDGNYAEVAERNLADLDALASRHRGRPVAIVLGGEVISPVTGPGLGGRNQAYVLSAARPIANRKRAVLSAGTDGRDGNSPACGAVADGQTLSRAAARGLDPQRYLAESDSYCFFRTLGDTIDMGFTDNNVRDIRLLLDFGN